MEKKKSLAGVARLFFVTEIPFLIQSSPFVALRRWSVSPAQNTFPAQRRQRHSRSARYSVFKSFSNTTAPADPRPAKLLIVKAGEARTIKISQLGGLEKTCLGLPT